MGFVLMPKASFVRLAALINATFVEPTSRLIPLSLSTTMARPRCVQMSINTSTNRVFILNLMNV